MTLHQLTYTELEVLDDALDVLLKEVQGPRTREQRASTQELRQYLVEIHALQTKIATAQCVLDESQ